MPGETVKFRLGEVLYQGDRYEFLVTDKRMLFYKRSGFLFKKDSVVSIKLEEILELRYKEEGLINKRGVIEVVTSKKKTSFSGTAAQMRELYKELQTMIG